MDGQVIGVNTAILSPNGGSIGIGFFDGVECGDEGGRPVAGIRRNPPRLLGVRIQDVTPDVAEAMGLTEASGALVTDVPEGPAKESGMIAGDVITQFDGQPVADTPI